MISVYRIDDCIFNKVNKRRVIICFENIEQNDDECLNVLLFHGINVWRGKNKTTCAEDIVETNFGDSLNTDLSFQQRICEWLDTLKKSCDSSMPQI